MTTTDIRPTATLRRGLGVVAALMMGLGAAPAMAASCTAANTTFTLTQGDGVRDSFCSADADSWTATDELFSLTGWAVAHKVRRNMVTATPGEDVPQFDILPLRGTSGWSVVNPGNFSQLVLVLAQPNGFGAFLLDSSQSLTGTWQTETAEGVLGNLSQATLWYRPDGARIGIETMQPEGPRSDVGVVPLPAAGWLLLAGMGVLAGLGWRRRHQA